LLSGLCFEKNVVRGLFMLLTIVCFFWGWEFSTKRFPVFLLSGHPHAIRPEPLYRFLLNLATVSACVWWSFFLTLDDLRIGTAPVTMLLVYSGRFGSWLSLRHPAGHV